MIKSALNEEQQGWLKKSSAVEQLQLATILELETLLSTFVPNDKQKIPPYEASRVRWRQRYRNAVERLQQAGIKTTESGMAEYISLRSEWDSYSRLLAPKFGFQMEEVDTALARGCNPGSTYAANGLVSGGCLNTDTRIRLRLWIFVKTPNNAD